ncbi:ThiF family adenylyltransferase [Streptomyces bohaiensis]|uniref:ThiF family adenylyltransferase n=1 Tax=Streptomyces bohaiensis TaxID=1431344 RepID=UPI003B807FC0
MHPMIKPALRRGWQDRQTVRFGVTPPHAVLLGPLDSATETFLALLDGTRGLPALRAAAGRLGMPPGAADRVARRLADAGLLEDATADRAAAARISERLRPDLAAQSLLTHEPGGGLGRLEARRAARVQVRGAGRVGAGLAVALAQAGVGRVEVVDGGRVEPADTAPGGIPAGYTGRRRDGAARAVVRAAQPWRSDADRGRRPEGARLVVLAPRDGVRAYVPDPDPAASAMDGEVPHLYAGVVEATGFVGPLVLPGVSACAECLLRHRTRREPSWPLLVGQWRNARTPGVPACDAALAVAVAGLAAATALAYLDDPASTPAGVRSELSLPTLDMRREDVLPHPECPCGAAAAAGGADGAGRTAEAGHRPERRGTAAAEHDGAARVPERRVPEQRVPPRGRPGREVPGRADRRVGEPVEAAGRRTAAGAGRAVT